MNRNTEREREWIAKVDVAPGKCRCMDHTALRRIDHARNGHTHAFTRVVISQYLLDATGELLASTIDALLVQSDMTS